MATFEQEIKLTMVENVQAMVRKIGQSFASLKAQAATLNASFNNLKNAASEFGGKLRNLSLVVAGFGASLFALAKQQGEYAEKIGIMSQKTGISTEVLQKWRYVAGLNNLELEDMVLGMRGLSKSMAEAISNPKSDVAQWMNRNKIAIRDVRTGEMRNLNELMGDISEVFAKSEDGGKKMATAMKIFSRAGVNLIPILNLGKGGFKELMKEAERYGIVLSKDTLKRQQEFDDNLDKLKFSIEGVKMAISDELIKSLNPLAVSTREWLIANRELIKVKVSTFTKELGKGLLIVFGALVKIGEVLSPVVNAIGGLSSVIAGLVGIYLSSLILSFGRLVFSLALVARAVVGFGLAILATPVGWFLAAVAAIAGIAYLIYKNWDGIKAFFKSIWDSLPAPLQTALSAVKDAFTGFVPFVVGLFTPLINTVSTVVSWIMKIKEAITGIPSKTISIQAPQIGSIGMPAQAASNVGGVSGVAVNPTAGSQKSASLFPRSTGFPQMNMGALAQTQPQHTKLDVNMRIDAEGRAKEIKAKSNQPLEFAANTGVMI